MSIENSPVEVTGLRPKFTDVDAQSAGDSQNRSRIQTLDKPPLSGFIKDLGFVHDSTPVFANQSLDTVLVDRLRRDALQNAKELKLPAIRATEKPVINPEKTVILRKNRLQKMLGSVAALRSRMPVPKAPSVQEVAVPELPLLRAPKRPLAADLMTPDAPILEEAEIVFEDYRVDIVDQLLTADLMTPDAPILEEEVIFHNTDFVNKIHVPTEPEEPRESQATVSQLAHRREVLRHRNLKSRLPALLGAASILAGSVFGMTADTHTKAVSHISVMPAATSIEQLQQQVAASQAAAPVVEASTPAAVTDAPQSLYASAPAAGVTTPAPKPAPAPGVNVEKPAPTPASTPTPTEAPAPRHHNGKKPQPQPRVVHAPRPESATEVPDSNRVYIVTPGAGDPTAAFAISEYRRRGVIPPGAQVIPNMYSAVIAPGMTQNSIQEGAQGVKNIIASLPPGVQAMALGFSQGSMANDRANKELTREGAKRGARFRDDGAPDAMTGLMRSPQYEMFKPFVQGVLGLQPEEMDPDTEVEMNVASGDAYGTNFDGEWRKIIKNLVPTSGGDPEDNPESNAGLRNHRIIGIDEKPVQIIRKGKITEKIYGAPQPVPADAQLLYGPYIAPEPNPLAPMPAGGDTSAIGGPDAVQPAPAAPVRDALTGVPANPAPERSTTPEFFGEQACPGGYFTPGDAPC